MACLIWYFYSPIMVFSIQPESVFLVKIGNNLLILFLLKKESEQPLTKKMKMKKLIISLVFLLISVHIFSQTPDFSVSGFGALATGGGSGAEVQVTTLAELKAALLRTDAIVIKINGTITDTVGGGGVLLEVKSNKTIIGVGSTAFLSMVQLYLKNSQNIIIRNIKFSMIGSTLESDADCISIATTSTNECKNIWIDHCEFFNVTPTLPETAAKKDLYDGLIDVKKNSHNITISWNYIHDHWKSCLIGYTDKDSLDRKITFHHNYFKNIKSRVPSYRHGTAHVYNNYYEALPKNAANPSSDGVNTRMNACLKVENNYFKDYTQSIYSADSDSDGYAYGSGNVFDNSPAQTASLCNSFVPPYTYSLDSASNVPSIVTQWAGVGKLDADVSTLSIPANKDQSVAWGNSITDIVFTWGGSATDVSITGLPDGLTSTKDATTQTLTIGGAPTESGTYTVSTLGSIDTASVEGLISVTNILPTLTSTANKTQTVINDSAITTIIFTWGGGATDVTISGLPSGLTSVKNTSDKTLTINGTPTDTGTYTVTTVGGTGSTLSINGTITLTYYPTLTTPENVNQTVISGNTISDIVFTWGGGATDLTVSSLPEGLTGTKNTSAQTLTISGIPSLTGTYNVNTSGGAGSSISVEGTITVTTDTTSTQILEEISEYQFTCNPTLVTNEITVSFYAPKKTEAILSIYNMSGITILHKAVSAATGTNTLILNLENLNAETYCISLQIDNKYYIQKILKK